MGIKKRRLSAEEMALLRAVLIDAAIVGLSAKAIASKTGKGVTWVGRIIRGDTWPEERVSVLHELRAEGHGAAVDALLGRMR